MKKVKLKKKRFLDWYFSDTDDYIHLAIKILKQLKHEGKSSITIEEIFEGCSELPDYIMENHDEDNEIGAYYYISEIELID